MATRNRQALRDLQTRLAARMQQARTEGVSASWLAVESAGRSLLLPLAQSGEIFPLAAVQHVPYTQYWFLGVSNLRGGLFGVVDFASFITGQTPARRSESAREQARLVALNPALEVNCAILIDRLGGLRNAQDFVAREDAGKDMPVYFAGNYTDQTGKQWQEIDLQAMSSQSDFLTIAAADSSQ
jgi:twitching motility protein PilI